MSKARERPRGWQMSGPRAAQNLQMPTPGTDKAGKCPAVARGCWAQLELTDALLDHVRLILLYYLKACAKKCFVSFRTRSLI